MMILYKKAGIVAIIAMAVVSFILSCQASAQSRLNVIETRIIYDNNSYCAFTGLTSFNGKYYCTFREDSSHRISFDDSTSWGSIVLLKSEDAKVKGPDHPHSMEPDEFKFMVDSIREVEKAMGSTRKEVQKEEGETVFVQRRCLYAKHDLKKGQVIKEEDLDVLRPALGILPKYKNVVIGKAVNKDILFAFFFARNEYLWWHDFVWCCDTDHNGDRIYVGKYHDIDGVNKNGFSIHRHLALRSCYGSVNCM